MQKQKIQRIAQNLVKPYLDSFRCSELQITKCPPDELQPKPELSGLKFGHAYTDHMFKAEWDSEHGWEEPQITKLREIKIHPGAKVLHYGLAAFEGAKAYRGQDGKIRFFRLDENIKRLLKSTRRLSLPEFDGNELRKCIHKLVQLDQEWIPESYGTQLNSLYIRPNILGTDPTLGVAVSRQAMLYTLLSPVGPYFATGFKPVKLYADPNFVRAWPGGAGNTKLGANYAPTLKVQRQAEKLGCQQVLWLFGSDMKLTEVGTMNVFVAMRNDDTGKTHLITPPLTDGLILPGITRKSILELARNWDDVICEERYMNIAELQQLSHENRLLEMFGSGTACCVCPISSVHIKDGATLHIPYTDMTTVSLDESPFGQQEQSMPLTKRILKSITDIQYGRKPSPWAQDLMYK